MCFSRHRDIAGSTGRESHRDGIKKMQSEHERAAGLLTFHGMFLALIHCIAATHWTNAAVEHLPPEQHMEFHS